MSIEERRSIRKYTNQPVEKAVIEEVIRAAALAPSAKNRQPGSTWYMPEQRRRNW